MGFDHLEEINNLVLHIWDAAVLNRLRAANAPMRYSDIGTAVDQWSQRRPSDSDLTRALVRLTKAGHVSRSDSGSRRSRVYTLTAAGRERASKISALIAALELDTEADEVTATGRSEGGGVDGAGRDGPIA